MNYAGILTRIVLPLSGAALATVGLYTAVFFWNDWFNGLIYLKSSQFPVMLFLRNIVTGTSMVGEAAGVGDKSAIAISIKSAVIVTSTLPIILLYPFPPTLLREGRDDRSGEGVISKESPEM